MHSVQDIVNASQHSTSINDSLQCSVGQREYTILYYTILYHTIPYHTIPYHTILYYTRDPLVHTNQSQSPTGQRHSYNCEYDQNTVLNSISKYFSSLLCSLSRSNEKIITTIKSNQNLFTLFFFFLTSLITLLK